MGKGSTHADDCVTPARKTREEGLDVRITFVDDRDEEVNKRMSMLKTMYCYSAGLAGDKEV